MALICEWNGEANEQLDSALHYYLSNFGEAAATALYLVIVDRLEVIRRYPDSGIFVSKYNQVRYVQVKKSHYIYYTYDDATLVVLALHSTEERDNPYR
jgi:plasmid stabilization system protein ParE